jgi:hypothetical protein
MLEGTDTYLYNTSTIPDTTNLSHISGFKPLPQPLAIDIYICNLFRTPKNIFGTDCYSAVDGYIRI